MDGTEYAYSIAELSERWNYHPRTLLRAIRDSRLPAFRTGRDWRVRCSVVEQIESGQQQPRQTQR